MNVNIKASPMPWTALIEKHKQGHKKTPIEECMNMKKHFKKKATKATKKHDQRHKKTPIEKFNQDNQNIS